MRFAVVALLMFLASPGCASAPVTHSPEASAAYAKTRAIKVLDLLRDTAVAAEAQTPPLISTDDARKVVTWHRAALKIMDAAGDWKALVGTSLDELLKTVSESTQARLQPYVELVRVILKGASS